MERRIVFRANAFSRRPLEPRTISINGFRVTGTALAELVASGCMNAELPSVHAAAGSELLAYAGKFLQAQRMGFVRRETLPCAALYRPWASRQSDNRI